jgi:hypothetical protein
MIYIIKEKDNDSRVKIGVTKDVAARLSNLQTGNPNILEVVAVFPGELEDEQALHSIFAEDRVLREWFIYSDRIKEFVRTKVLPEPTSTKISSSHAEKVSTNTLEAPTVSIAKDTATSFQMSRIEPQMVKLLNVKR